MGYDFHITRAENWAENEGLEIEPSEWHDVIERDPELRLAGYNGPHFAIWEGQSEDDEAWLDWCDGNLTTKNPDDALLHKMLQIAGTLGAMVQGDDGETYTEADIGVSRSPAKPIWSWPLLSLILSVGALLALAIVIPLDAFVRQDHPVGASIPLHWVIVLTSILCVGIASWLVSVVFAIQSLLTRQSPAVFGWLALVMNGISGGVMMLLE